MANTTNFNWETPDDTDLVKDGAAAIRTLGSAIDTSLVDLKGGTTGQVLSKATNTDMDFTWVTSDDANAIQNAIVDAKGDLIAASAADTPARLAVGTNNQRLVAASGEATGLKYVSDTQNTVIDAAGDLLYGTAADTLGRLAIGTAGQVLKVNSGATAPEWGTAGGSDVVKVASGSFSSATTINVDNCFSSDYDYYKIFFDLSSGTTQNFDLRLRASGSDDSTANYNIQFLYGASTTNNMNRDSSQTSFRVGTTFSGGEINYTEITVFNPFLAEITGFMAHVASKNLSASTGNEIQLFHGSHCVSSSFTGFTILNGGNKTGKYRVYGFKN